MASLLTTLVTFVSVMLILALAAESIQEIIKAMFTIKGQTMKRALRGLVTEAARDAGHQSSAEDILQSVEKRLQVLGQNGVRPGSLRLDALNHQLLADLIKAAEPSRISGLRGLSHEDGKTELQRVAARTTTWYPLAMEPVDDRYRRRMRVFALLSSAIVVFALNADAWTVFQKARTDRVFQVSVAADVAVLDSLYRQVQKGSEVRGDTGKAAAGTQKAQEGQADTEALRRELARTLQTDGYVFGKPGAFRWGDLEWWIGMLASLLLVSLGAPFWHDTLEALFGLKNRIRAEAKRTAAQVPEEKKP